MFKIVRKTFVVIILITFPFSLFAQDPTYEQRFRKGISRYNASFLMPKGFSGLDGSTDDFLCGDHKRGNTFSFLIVNKDSSVVVAFSSLKADSPAEEALTKRINPDYEFNKNYLALARNLADTVNNKIIMYGEKYSKEKFNADDVGIYSRPCTIPYRNKYPNVKVVFGLKKDVVQFEMTYFYTDAAKGKIEKIIKESAGSIKFSDSSTDTTK